MLVGAVPAIRRHGYFEVFYWSHLTYLLFCLLHCLHSPVGLAWLLPPGLLFLLYKVSWTMIHGDGDNHLIAPPQFHVYLPWGQSPFSIMSR